MTAEENIIDYTLYNGVCHVKHSALEVFVLEADDGDQVILTSAIL